MNTIRDRLAGAGINYYFVSFTFSKDRSKFFKYTDSLGINAPAFLAPTKSQIESLSMMVVPSHILVDRNGIILQKWPGTDSNKEVRDRMADQVLIDTFHTLGL
ncbi:MAG: hypothetical protein AABN95_16995 [Acidobacteriota bacterium]